MNRAAWLIFYGVLCALAFVIEKAKEYAAEKIAPKPDPGEP